MADVTEILKQFSAKKMSEAYFAADQTRREALREIDYANTIFYNIKAKALRTKSALQKELRRRVRGANIEFKPTSFGYYADPMLKLIVPHLIGDVYPGVGGMAFSFHRAIYTADSFDELANNINQVCAALKQQGAPKVAQKPRGKP